mmetsp:Transcript_779/g.1710  ORF Transcript_779/g.1710 Transcript_779/m.1710 type:complete len:265 (-) Transcript_779:844-1638(-)
MCSAYVSLQDVPSCHIADASVPMTAPTPTPSMLFRCRRTPLPSVRTHPLGLLSSRSSSSSSLLTRRIRLPRILPPSLTSPILAKMSSFFGGMRIQAAASLVASVLSTLRVRDGLRFRHGGQTASSLLPADVCSLHGALSGAAPNFCTVRKNLLGVGPSFVFWCQKRWWRETLSSLPREPSPPTFVTLTEVFFWPAQKLCSPPIGCLSTPLPPQQLRLPSSLLPPTRLPLQVPLLCTCGTRTIRWGLVRSKLRQLTSPSPAGGSQ